MLAGQILLLSVHSTAPVQIGRVTFNKLARNAEEHYHNHKPHPRNKAKSP